MGECLEIQIVMGSIIIGRIGTRIRIGGESKKRIIIIIRGERRTRIIIIIMERRGKGMRKMMTIYPILAMRPFFDLRTFSQAPNPRRQAIL